MLCVMCRSSLLDQGMLVNIQQPVIQSDGTLLLATESKVQMFFTVTLNNRSSICNSSTVPCMFNFIIN